MAASLIEDQPVRFLGVVSEHGPGVLPVGRTLVADDAVHLLGVQEFLGFAANLISLAHRLASATSPFLGPSLVTSSVKDVTT